MGLPMVGSPASLALIQTDQNPGLGVAAHAALEYKSWQSSNQLSYARCSRAAAACDNSALRRSPALPRQPRKSRTGEIRAAPGQTRPHRESLAKPHIKSSPSIPGVGGPVRDPASPSRHSGPPLDNQSRRSYLRSPPAGVLGHAPEPRGFQVTLPSDLAPQPPYLPLRS